MRWSPAKETCCRYEGAGYGMRKERVVAQIAKSIGRAAPIFFGPCTLRGKVPGHPLHFVSRQPLHFRLIDPPAAGGRESGKRFAFSKAAMPPSFPPLVVSSGS